MELKIKTVSKDSIFCEEFKHLQTNNIIDLSKPISILYGPNGTGKTSLAETLNKKPGTKYELEINNTTHTSTTNDIFHVIHDQNGRNLIIGETQDFILGENIKREYELKRNLDESFDTLFRKNLPATLKTSFNITKKSTPFDIIITNKTLLSFISDIANNKSKGNGIDRAKFLEAVQHLHPSEIPEHNEIKSSFFISDFEKEDSIIRKTQETLKKPPHKEEAIETINETKDAVIILKKYNKKSECIVCDNNIEREKLLLKKEDLSKQAFNSLSQQAKNIIEEILNKISNTDPFEIHQALTIALNEGNLEPAEKLLIDFEEHSKIYNARITNAFIEATAQFNLSETYNEYSQILLEKPEFEDEDIVFISQFLSESLDRKIELSRDENKNLKLLLGGNEFLNKERTNLHLSNGEQNFLSLSFELLKSKKTDDKIIVLDDPISSFDSIYKNKIAYSILKILNNKNSIILTHNTDLIKLLEHQKQNCFNLYFLNNTPGEMNGFIQVNSRETKILIYLHELINLLRDEITDQIIDEKNFLIALTPFMRGYCQITGRNEEKDKLTSIMHGYKTDKINLSEIYNALFSNKVIKDTHIISAQDIIKIDPSEIKIIKTENYPLLSKTLNHTFSYLYLRLVTEKTLADKFKINTNKFELLTQIIDQSFKHSDNSQISNRVFFLSRKTLLNEFNHFEIDMNIFQPAIDITNKALEKEKSEILDRLKNL
ncbi:AAA family ATPase [Pseudomonas sp.]|uniref:AAA family ATPase n=1 Tax=Pseudomonas sp. TaxID=306 RepID=UPI0027370651|nr:AAA family ATPase [Pseudomonas sp.]MDP3816340.1 hypothetical protein [Pseudomonas sp.]